MKQWIVMYMFLFFSIKAQELQGLTWSELETSSEHQKYYAAVVQLRGTIYDERCNTTDSARLFIIRLNKKREDSIVAPWVAGARVATRVDKDKTTQPDRTLSDAERVILELALQSYRDKFPGKIITEIVECLKKDPDTWYMVPQEK